MHYHYKGIHILNLTELKLSYLATIYSSFNDIMMNTQYVQFEYLSICTNQIHASLLI